MLSSITISSYQAHVRFISWIEKCSSFWNFAFIPIVLLYHQRLSAITTSLQSFSFYPLRFPFHFSDRLNVSQTKLLLLSTSRYSIQYHVLNITADLPFLDYPSILSALLHFNSDFASQKNSGKFCSWYLFPYWNSSSAPNGFLYSIISSESMV